MDPTVEEALRDKENAKKQFAIKDFAGAKQCALRAQTLCPHLEGIANMVATYEIHAARETKVNGEVDYYSVLGVDPSADESTLKKRYKKLAMLLHPDKNKTVGGDEAFKIVSEAWAVLSDSDKRSWYDANRNMHLSAAQWNVSTVYGTSGVPGSSNPPPSVNRLDTFWTVCTSCHVQHEYLRKYMNMRLHCKNCRGVLIALETGGAPSNTPSDNRLDTFWTVCTSCHVRHEYLRNYMNMRLYCKNCRGVLVALETGGAPSNTPSSENRLDTFWTVCTSCHAQHEYLRKYMHMRLYCKNCRGVLVPLETGGAPSIPPSSDNRLDTFWTVCTSCHVQQEYLRKYVNMRLYCKNCRGVLVDLETRGVPATYTPWPYTSETGYANHSYNAGAYVPNT